MTQEQSNFFYKVIKPKLIAMAIDCSLPSDMNEIDTWMFEEEADSFNRSEAVRMREFENELAHYISSDDVPGALRLLIAESEENGDESADNIVTMWEPLEGRYTVDELLDLIGY